MLAVVGLAGRVKSSRHAPVAAVGSPSNGVVEWYSPVGNQYVGCTVSTSQIRCDVPSSIFGFTLEDIFQSLTTKNYINSSGILVCENGIDRDRELGSADRIRSRVGGPGRGGCPASIGRRAVGRSAPGTPQWLASMLDLVTLAVAIGGPVLVLVFFFEGMLIGKIVQPPVVFVGYVTAASPSAETLVLVAALCAATATVGQWLLYRGFADDGPDDRRPIPYLDRLVAAGRVRLPDRHVDRFQRGFDAFGGLAILATNATPGLRGYMAVVAALSGYPRRRFLLAAGVGNCCYFLVLVAAAHGLLGLASLVGGA